MDDATIKTVVSEVSPLLAGRRFGKIFQLKPSSFAIDFGLREHGVLFISAEPALSRLYLIRRRLRDLEKQSTAPGQFALLLRKELAQATVKSIEKDDAERIVRLHLKACDDLGEEHGRVLVVQLTGRGANLFLLNPVGVIIAGARPGRGAGQLVGEKYQPPPPQRGSSSIRERVKSPTVTEGNSMSEVLDSYYQALASEQEFEARAASARAGLRKKISQRQKLLTKLQADLTTHADFEAHKRIGDLLLANVASAKRSGDRVKLIDYFADGAPQIEIEIEEKSTLPEEASRRFSLYSRSKRARQQIASRIAQTESELQKLAAQEKQLEEVIAARDKAALASLTGSEPPAAFPSPSGRGWERVQSIAGGSRVKRDAKIPGTRRYISSDGFEILVGRAARDNDNLTFKIARPNDLWLHAADYPGSHVVVRNPTRKELPHRAIIEAAQLAAYFSQASKDPKVDVHYTPRKFLAKPKGAAPGLVRMSRFKNITVEPREELQRP